MEEEIKTCDKMEIEDHLLSDQVKWMIVHYKNQGYGNKETARIVGELYNRPTLSHQTVKTIWVKYQKNNDVTNKWNLKGRPHAMNEEDIEDLLDFFRDNPKKSVYEAKRTLDLPYSRQTLNDVLLEKGLKAYRAPKKFFISEDNVFKRHQFAKVMEKYKLSYWKKVLFSDESSFSLVGSNGRIQVRRTVDEDYQENTIQYKIQSDSLMVWGVISYHRVGSLVRVDSIEEGETTLNRKRYLTLLQRY